MITKTIAIPLKNAKICNKIKMNRLGQNITLKALLYFNFFKETALLEKPSNLLKLVYLDLFI